jgi:hypothetical protein
MIQKINNYLVTNYPQMWNTRLVWNGLVLGGIHLLFFIGGFCKEDIIPTLNEYGLNRLYVPDDNFILSILISILFIIGWLWFYLRHNPIKSFYPVGKLYLTKEFIIIIATVIFASTFFVSYANGFWARVVSITSKAELKQEIDNLNIAYGLMPQNGNNYIKENSCESLEAQYEINNNKKDKSYYNSKTDFYNNANNNARNENLSGEFYYKYYCRQYLSTGNSPVILTCPQIHTEIMSCINDEAKLKNVFKTLTTTLKKYKLKYNYDYNQHTSEVWAQHGKFTNGFNFEYSAQYETRNNNNEYENSENTKIVEEAVSAPIRKYTAIGDLKSVLDQFQEYYNKPIRDHEGCMAILYFLFGISGLIFTLRLISVRHFMFSIIGSLLILIFSGLIIGVLFRSSQSSAWSFYFILFGLFYLIYFTTKQSKKTLATLCHTWFMWLLPSILPFFYASIKMENSSYGYRDVEVVSQWQPLIKYVEAHTILILGLNLLFAFVCIVFRAYFAKKLLAQAEN